MRDNDGKRRDAHGRRVAWRRTTFAGLVLTSAAAALAGLGTLLAQDGFGIADGIMLFLFLLTLPWTMIGFWNALIGLAILKFSRDPLALTCPPARAIDENAPLRGRTAIVMVVHDEDPARVFRHLDATVSSLDLAGGGDGFEVFLLSDTRDPDIAAEEERRMADWQARDSRPGRLHYRRRSSNKDFKTGNLWDFLGGRGKAFDYFVLLDADSLMGGDRLMQMVRMMDQTPTLGILQSLAVGLPTQSAFARVFQFGMRHGMRAYTTGSAWWQDDAGPYWGHNAIIRTAAFMAHCKLPTLPGRPPLGGLVLSHDQVEAALMRAAGFEVRVIVEEGGSYEENPPTLLDFIRRDLRWCQGNMQYGRLIARPGLHPMGRLQLLLAMMMYVSAPAWLGFMAMGLGHALAAAAGLAGDPAAPGFSQVSINLAIGLFATMMAMNFMPKLAGIADILLRPEARRSYGGARRILLSGLIELFASLILGPIMATAQAIFMAGLLRGKAIRWTVQARDRRELSWGQAAAGLWPQLALGVVLLVVLGLAAPAVLPWAVPVLGGLVLGVPFAVITSRGAPGALLWRAGLCMVPEEQSPPIEQELAGFRPRHLQTTGEPWAEPARTFAKESVGTEPGI